MPSPSAIWVCDSPSCWRIRRNRGPTNSFLAESPAMGSLPHFPPPPPSFRGDAQRRTRNLEILGSCFARPGMTAKEDVLGQTLQSDIYYMYACFNTSSLERKPSIRIEKFSV